MAQRKPTLGYPSRTAAVLALREQGKGFRQIAEMIGIDIKNVYSLASEQRQHKIEVRLTLKGDLEKAVRRREIDTGKTPTAICREALEQHFGTGSPRERIKRQSAERAAKKEAERAERRENIEQVARKRKASTVAKPAKKKPTWSPKTYTAVSSRRLIKSAPAQTAQLHSGTEVPPIPFDQRQAAIAAATATLKAHCVLVDALDRDALVRRYRVSGVDRSLLLEEVVHYANLVAQAERADG